MRSFVGFCWRYGLIFGIFSARYNLVKRQFVSTQCTRLYSLAVNLVTLAALPWSMWVVGTNALNSGKFPVLMLQTAATVFSVNYASMAYTLLSRCYRDRELEFGIGRDIAKLEALIPEHNAADACTVRQLRHLYYAKFGIVVYLSIANYICYVASPLELNWSGIIALIVLGSGLNILSVVTFSYFAGMWHMCRGFSYINKRLNELVEIASGRQLCQSEIKLLHKLWRLHAFASRTTLRLQKIYKFQMLAARFDHIISSVSSGYFGCIFIYSYNISGLVMVFGMTTYMMQLVDYYLVDLICAKVVEGQRKSGHIIPAYLNCSNEFQRELDSFFMYLHNSKLRLWICGLYESNKNRWFIGLTTILSYTIILLQFHIYLKNKEKI